MCATIRRFTLAVALIPAPTAIQAQEVDAIYLATQTTAQSEAIQRVRKTLEPHLDELGRQLIILSDLSDLQNLSSADIETQQRAYRALGTAFVGVVERFLDGMPQISSRFDSIAGYVGDLAREVQDAMQESSVELEKAERTVEAVADTLRLVRRFAASGRDDPPCDIEAAENQCSERIRRVVAQLNRESMRAFARVEERGREKDELKAAHARLAEIRADVVNRKRELTDLREHLADTADELATRLAHRDRMSTANRVTLVWGQASELSLLVRDSLTAAMNGVLGDLGRTELSPWVPEQMAVAVRTAEAVRAILARRDSVRATAGNERSNER